MRSSHIASLTILSNAQDGLRASVLVERGNGICPSQATNGHSMRPIRKYLKLVSAPGYLPRACYRAVNKASGVFKLLAPTPEAALTLTICYPFGRSLHSPQRFMVRASPLGPSRPADSPAAASVVSSQRSSSVARNLLESAFP